jgi:hypothetical protein
MIFCDYFGPWPPWFGLFLESCRTNPTIDWYIHADTPPDFDPPDNVRFQILPFKQYCARASDILNVRFAPESPYNICNLRPMLGVVHAAVCRDYDFIGWGDIDVIYGQIRSIYTDDVLTANVVSADAQICSGHLTLMRNEPWLCQAFHHLRDWRQRLQDPNAFEWGDSLDESHLTALFSPNPVARASAEHRSGSRAPSPDFYLRNRFQEQWTTPFTPKPWRHGGRVHPEVWFWRDGEITNEQDGAHTFPYLHLMNFKAKRWVNEALYGDAPTWSLLDRCMHFEIEELRARQPGSCHVRIDRHGLHLMSDP